MPVEPIDVAPLWTIPASALGRAEGLSFSRDGTLLAIAEADADRVSVWRAPAAGSAAAPERVLALEGAACGIDYPHGVDISPDGRLLAVACRGGSSLTFYARRGEAGRYGPEPICTLRGHRSRLDHTDGVAFVPPHAGFVAAVSLSRGAITVYRRRWWGRGYRRKPCFALCGPVTRLHSPDGLAFSLDGTLLAATNHGYGTVSLYARAGRGPRYGPEPLAELGGAGDPIRTPHSVAFSHDGRLLAVSDAGGRHAVIYGREPGGSPLATSFRRVQELEACDPDLVGGALRADPVEGGSKGVAFGPGVFAVSNASLGVRVHALAAGPGGGGRRAG